MTATPHEVPSVHTPVTLVQAAEALWFAHTDIIGGTCEIELLTTLLIQFDVETAAGTECFDYDLGNLRGRGPDGAWQRIRGANEIIDGKVVTGAAVEAGFAAFSSAREGAQAMIRYLGTASHPPKPNRFQGAWDAAKRGGLVEYAWQLHANGYFTADPVVYARGLLSRRERCRAAVATFLESLQPEPARI